MKQKGTLPLIEFDTNLAIPDSGNSSGLVVKADGS